MDPADSVSGPNQAAIDEVCLFPVAEDDVRGDVIGRVGGHDPEAQVQTHDPVSRIWEEDDEVTDPDAEYLPSRSTEDVRRERFRILRPRPRTCGDRYCDGVRMRGDDGPGGPLWLRSRNERRRRTAGRCARRPAGNGIGEEARAAKKLGRQNRLEEGRF